MLLRRRLHATSPPPRGDRVLIAQSWRELNRIGINLNQAVHALHAATMVDSRLDLAREAARVASFRDEVADQLRVLGRALKGDMAYRSEEHTSELQSLMRISYAVFCLKKKNTQNKCPTSNT